MQLSIYFLKKCTFHFKLYIIDLLNLMGVDEAYNNASLKRGIDLS